VKTSIPKLSFSLHASAQEEAFALLFLQCPPQAKLQLQLTLSPCTFGGAVSGAPKQEKLPRCDCGGSSASPAETAWPMT
jgi:hypothetical protein